MHDGSLKEKLKVTSKTKVSNLKDRILILVIFHGKNKRNKRLPKKKKKANNQPLSNA